MGEVNNSNPKKQTVTFTPEEFDKVVQSLMFKREKHRENVIIPKMLGPVIIRSDTEKMIHDFQNGCIVKSIASCVVGYGIGAALGLFSSSVNPTIPDPKATTQTVREILTDMKTSLHSYGKNFAIFALVFTAIECTIESYRGKTHWTNATYTGVITGGLIGLRGGVKAGLFGGAGLALASTALEFYFSLR